MPDSEDRDVLEFIGTASRTFEDIEERFPTFDLLRVIRSGLVEISRSETADEVETHRFEDRYVLTERGASAVGVVLTSGPGPVSESDGDLIELAEE